LERPADVLGAAAALADALCDQLSPPMQIQLANVLRVSGIGHERERPDLAPALDAHRDDPRFVHSAQHFTCPEPLKNTVYSCGRNAERHSPARTASAQSHHQTGLRRRAAVSRREDAERAMVAPDEADGLALVAEIRVPHQR